LILEAPLGLGQLLETTLLNLINYPALITTNAARMVLRAAPKPCIEFGLRRAQGPDGAMSASKYSYLGGFVATSNVQAGKVFGIPIAGTHAHSYVQSFVSLEEIQDLTLLDKKNGCEKKRFLPAVLEYRTQLNATQSNDGELAAFCAYACAFPDSCLCLIDTYDTVGSGLLNFSAVALALDDFGYAAKGVRLDSGNLRTLSLACQNYFQKVATDRIRPFFNTLTIVASTDINEDSLENLRQEPHGITTFGIGTNLVTCQKQPALGCVYKLVEWKGQPRIKLSQDLPKVTIPGSKKAYRLYDSNGQMMMDVMALASEAAPVVNERFLCRDPFSNYRCAAIPSRVVDLHTTIFQAGRVLVEMDLEASRNFVKEQLDTLPDPVKTYSNPHKYPVLVSQGLFDYLREVWEREAPVEEKR
jgi:nicotinate phosphoribosyltransferase